MHCMVIDPTSGDQWNLTGTPKRSGAGRSWSVVFASRKTCGLTGSTAPDLPPGWSGCQGGSRCCRRNGPWWAHGGRPPERGKTPTQPAAAGRCESLGSDPLRCRHPPCNVSRWPDCLRWSAKPLATAEEWRKFSNNPVDTIADTCRLG